MSLLHRHTAALAEIGWTNECLVCGAYTVPHVVGHHYVLDHTDDCAWAEARNTVGGRRRALDELVKVSQEMGLYNT